MKSISKILILFLALVFCILPIKDLYAGVIFGESILTLSDTDTNDADIETASSIFFVFDLRDRETFIQLTNPDSRSTGLPGTAHVQIFDVTNNCNENNFFDDYTVNDTHVYNMRDIQTNDGNPSGVVLPDGAYGIVVISMAVVQSGLVVNATGHFGNLRILDDNGYEYRTNGHFFVRAEDVDNNIAFYSFNYNQPGGISLSDIFGVTLFATPDEQIGVEWIALPVQGIFSPFDVDIYDLNEVPFSCRDVIFSCVDENNPLLEEVLTIAGTANVASFEYGINDAIPHSKGGELLCPGNTIGEGSVLLRPEPYPETQDFMDIIDNLGVVGGPFFFGFVGFNNGNGRGSMDSLWVYNFFEEDVD